MRKPPRPLLRPTLGIALAGSGFAALLALGTPGIVETGLQAQTFNLPEPTPTPTPAPQGPVDVRNGVAIGPRVIPDSTAPTPQPSPSATTAAPPPAPAPTSSQTATAPRPVRESAPARPPATTVAPPRASDPAPSQPLVLDEVSPPAGAGSDAGAGEDGFYSVDNSAGGGVSTTAPTTAETSDAGFAAIVYDNLQSARLGIWSLMLAVLAAIAGLGWWLWRRKSRQRQSSPITTTNLAAGVRETIAARLPTEDAQPDNASQTVQPLDEPQVQPMSAASAPVQLEYRLDIISASRSVMMFTVHYQLTITNRSNHAVRDLSISSELVCARQGKAVTQQSRPLDLIERIGPHQSRSVTGQIQLPLRDVSPLRQGSKPLLVPLATFVIEREGAKLEKLNFVLGTPSASANGRLHPIPLDGPPGGLPALLAQQVKQPAATEPA